MGLDMASEAMKGLGGSFFYLGLGEKHKKDREGGRRGRRGGLKFLGEMGAGCFNSCRILSLVKEGTLDKNGFVEFV